MKSIELILAVPKWEKCRGKASRRLELLGCLLRSYIHLDKPGRFHVKVISIYCKVAGNVTYCRYDPVLYSSVAQVRFLSFPCPLFALDPSPILARRKLHAGGHFVRLLSV